MSSDLPNSTSLADENELLRGRIQLLEEQLRSALEALKTGMRQESEERVRVARQLLERQHLESLGLLASGLAHEFNNTLTVILGNAELALLDALPGSELAYSLDAILVGSRRATQLTTQLLAYAGKSHLLTQPLDLNELLNGADSLLRLTLPQGCTLTYRLTTQPPLVAGDAVQLRQVLLNLIANAIEAINKPVGTISIETEVLNLDRVMLDALLFGQEREIGSYLHLIVRDDGSGMDGATLARIFDPFFSTRFAGRGLGLAAVQGIVRGHKGALQVESTPGVGTTFSIYLPTLPAQD